MPATVSASGKSKHGKACCHNQVLYLSSGRAAEQLMLCCLVKADGRKMQVLTGAGFSLPDRPRQHRHALHLETRLARHRPGSSPQERINANLSATSTKLQFHHQSHHWDDTPPAVYRWAPVQQPVFLQREDPLEQVLPLQHGPGEGQLPEGLQELPDEADLLVELGSLQHAGQCGDQVGHRRQLGEGEGAAGAHHRLQLCLPHGEAQLLAAVQAHVAHEVGKVACGNVHQVGAVAVCIRLGLLQCASGWGCCSVHQGGAVAVCIRLGLLQCAFDRQDKGVWVRIDTELLCTQ